MQQPKTHQNFMRDAEDPELKESRCSVVHSIFWTYVVWCLVWVLLVGASVLFVGCMPLLCSRGEGVGSGHKALCTLSASRSRHGQGTKPRKQW